MFLLVKQIPNKLDGNFYPKTNKHYDGKYDETKIHFEAKLTKDFGYKPILETKQIIKDFEYIRFMDSQNLASNYDVQNSNKISRIHFQISTMFLL